MNDNDDDLRARFSALRERDATELPAFAPPARVVTMRAVAARRRTGLKLAWAAGGVLAAVGAALWFVPRPNARSQEPAALALSPWRTPTDTLLAGSTDPLAHMSWSALPTAGLGQKPSDTALELR